MEKTLKFNSQVATNRSQSERLLALGLKPETADMSSDGWNDPVVSWGMEWSKEVIESGLLPAWSLHRLIEIVAQTQYPYYVISKELPIYDALCERIEWLIKEGYFNKEYLVV